MLTEHLESQHVAATEVWAPESWTERSEIGMIGTGNGMGGGIWTSFRSTRRSACEILRLCAIL